jgi:hypothetical protein
MVRIMAMRRKAAAMRQSRSKSRERRRLRLIHRMVRSTIQRFGGTTKRWRSQRRTMSIFQMPVRRRRRPSSALIACVADDALDDGEQPARLPQQWLGAVPVLDVGGMHDHREQHADGVGQQVALAVDDLLARVIAGRVESRRPFARPSPFGCR